MTWTVGNTRPIKPSDYEKPGYNENGEAYFVFENKTK